MNFLIKENISFQISFKQLLNKIHIFNVSSTKLLKILRVIKQQLLQSYKIRHSKIMYIKNKRFSIDVAYIRLIICLLSAYSLQNRPHTKYVLPAYLHAKYLTVYTSLFATHSSCNHFLKHFHFRTPNEMFFHLIWVLFMFLKRIIRQRNCSD